MVTYIYKNEQQLGPFTDTEVDEGLRKEAFSPDDLAWREGMPDWQSLSALLAVPSPPAVVQQKRIFEVKFRTAFQIDKLGFVHRGKLEVTSDTVEIHGQKNWHWSLRVLAFLIGYPSFTYFCFLLSDFMPGGFIGLAFALFTLIGSPIVVLILVRRWCASSTIFPVSKSNILQLTRVGNRIEAKIRTAGSRTKRALWVFAHESEARELEELIQSQ